jgi:hypothetical protein
MHYTTLLVEHKQEEVPNAVQEWLHRLLASDYAPEDCYVGPDDFEIHDIVTLYTLALELTEEAKQYPDDPDIPAPSAEVLAWLSEHCALIEKEGCGRFLWVTL